MSLLRRVLFRFYSRSQLRARQTDLLMQKATELRWQRLYPWMLPLYDMKRIDDELVDLQREKLRRDGLL